MNRDMRTYNVGNPSSDAYDTDFTGTRGEDARAHASEFRRALQGENAEKDSTMQEEHRQKKKFNQNDAMPLPPAFSGDALLRTLGQGPTTINENTFPQDASRLAEALADSILVSTDNSTGKDEVRISLKNSVLLDTEVILLREGENLVVRLSSSNASSLQLLKAAQQDLKTRLEAQGIAATVELHDDRESSSRGEREHSGSSGQRSRGLDYLAEQDQ